MGKSFSHRTNKPTLTCLIAILIALVIPRWLSAQSGVYQTNAYWGLGEFISSVEYLAPTQLAISKSGNNVKVSWYSLSTNSFLLSATSSSPDAVWFDLNVTNSHFAQRTVTLPATNSEQYYRLAAARTSLMPIFGFAIFYNSQLEFTYTGTMTIQGRTHANGPICLGPGTSSSLRFNGTVTTRSSILYSNLGGYAVSTMTGPVTYSGNPAFMTNTPALTLPGLTTNHHAIIDMPPVGESTLSATGLQRFYNKASVVLLVSNTTTRLIVKDSGSSTGTDVLFTNATATGPTGTLTFLVLTNKFYDFREGKWVMPTQIDMGKLSRWLLTNGTVTTRFPAGSGVYPNILYVADFRTLTNLHAIRLTNGSVISTNGLSQSTATGLTIATPNPLYVWGNYNCPNPTHLGTTNTSATFPASLICDALTVLSSNWVDSVYSTAALSSRPATSTTINAAIIAGTVYTTGTATNQWSGGVPNLARLMEDWAGDTLTMNTSLVNLYASNRATNQFQNPGTYYNAPTRNIARDQNFNDPAKLPPGTPGLSVIEPAN